MKEINDLIFLNYIKKNHNSNFKRLHYASL